MADVVFIPAKTAIMVESREEGVEVWVAAVNERAFKQGATIALTS